MFKYRDTFSECELTETVNRQIFISRENSEVSQVPKKGAHWFLQLSTFNREIHLADHKLAVLASCLGGKPCIMRERNTPQSTMMLLNLVDCMVSENLPMSKFKSLIVLLHELGLENIYIFRVFSVYLVWENFNLFWGAKLWQW